MIKGITDLSKAGTPLRIVWQLSKFVKSHGILYHKTGNTQAPQGNNVGTGAERLAQVGRKCPHIKAR